MRVVCAVVIHQGKVLACRRAMAKDEGGKWEFPGGKVEAGESDQDALVREIKEELAMEIDPGDFVEEVIRGEITLVAYRGLWNGGGQEVREHEEVRWVSSGEGDGLDWAPADVPIWSRVKSLFFSKA